MKTILTVIGARPQIIKASALSRIIETEFASELNQILVHTGQHYDENMSAVFFDELGIPMADFNLKVGSSSHAVQTAKIMEGIEALILSEKPDGVLVYGDTNSTIAAALAASKLEIPVVHVEAGLRSFNKSMPEEINRILCDHVSTLLFCPTQSGIDNLANEGFDLEEKVSATIDQPIVYACGDIMYDNSLHFSSVSDSKSTILAQLDLHENGFVLVTIHRNANTDDPSRLNSIFSALLRLQEATGLKIVLPLHPRTTKMMEQLLTDELNAKLTKNNQVMLVPPAGFLDIIALEKNAKLIVTDSGGLQKEAFFFQKPCVVLRPETEWVEIVQNGNAILADADESRILEAALQLIEKTDFTYPTLFGDGHAARFIAQKILDKI
ncbi:MAG: UDP-N-acetylglucosamine 2-epimerase (non-hydrolyzing) [Crocinitomicaceae bacterium]|nr:MAG: UDP-N-acetylglucosamine 2-epimerase (non-hydrolyzing) [Crocinitomicaceae bacterium]